MAGNRRLKKNIGGFSHIIKERGMEHVTNAHMFVFFFISTFFCLLQMLAFVITSISFLLFFLIFF